MATRPARRTQAERSATTRAALLAAAFDCLVERGFSGTTTTEVTRRAGVSLGALLHHFPTKADMLTAAVGHVMQRRQDDFRKAIADIEPGADRLDAAIDLLWSAFNGPTFPAWVELWVGARTDPDLADSLRSIDAEFERGSQEIFAELFPSDEYPDARFLQYGMRFAMSLMDGVALRGLVVQPVDTIQIELLKALARERIARADDTERLQT
jgi:AcrR family transcriptional regulator